MAQDTSTALSDALASPPVVRTVRGLVHSVADTIEVSDNANADTAQLKLNVPVEALIRRVIVAADDLGTSTTMSVGLYKKNDDNTFTAVSAAAFASAMDVATAATAPTDVRFLAKDINTVNARCFALAGLSAKPAYADLHVGVSFPVGTTAVGTVTLIVDYLV